MGLWRGLEVWVRSLLEGVGMCSMHGSFDLKVLWWCRHRRCEVLRSCEAIEVRLHCDYY